MFASRFFRPAFRTATRSFTTTAATATARTRAPFFTSHPTPFPSTCKSRTKQWRTTFKQSQHRAYARQAFNYQRFQASRSLFRRWAAHPHFYYHVAGVGLVCSGVYISNLERVPVSGRMRFNIVSPAWEKQFGESQFQQVLQQEGSKILPEYTKEHQMVQRVLERLVPHSGLQDDEWEVRVIDDGQANAFVIPGGKVFVYRGLLDICQGDDGLATVLGHEIAHNVAHHMAERLSQSSILLPFGLLFSLFIGVDFGITNTVLNLAAQLPNSRSQEREADYIGLLMMAESCYDPSAAIGLWSRMEKAQKDAPPEFLSTHPDSHNRLLKMQEYLPEARAKGEESGCRNLSAYADDFYRTVDSQRW